MWSGGQTGPVQPAGGPGSGGSGVDIDSVVNNTINKINQAFNNSSDNLEAMQKIDSILADALGNVPKNQQGTVFQRIRSGVSEGAKTIINDIQSASSKQADTATGKKRGALGGGGGGGGGGASKAGKSGKAGQASNEEQIAEYKEEQHRGRMDSLQNKQDAYQDQVDQVVNNIEDLKAQLVDLSKKAEAEHGQLGSEVARLDSSWNQIGHLRQKHQLLTDKAMQTSARLHQAWDQYRIQLDQFIGLNKRDILEKVEATWEEVMFRMLNSFDSLAEAVTGVKDGSPAPSGRTARVFAPEAEPNYYTTVQPHIDQLNLDGQSIEDSSITIAKTEDEINSGYEQVARKREGIDRQTANREASLSDSISRTEERYADLMERIDKVGEKMEESAAEYASGNA